MKYLLVLAVLVVGFWWWRHNRDAERSDRSQRPPSAPPADHLPRPMVTCRHCGLHLPLHEAVQGVAGVYCCANHHKLAEG